MGPLTSICSQNAFNDLKEKYGQIFVKLMVAEKAKETINQEFSRFLEKSNEIFQGFCSKSSSLVEEKTTFMRNLFEELKIKVNSAVPGGIFAAEKLKGESLEQFSGFNSLLQEMQKAKEASFGKIEGEKDRVIGELNGKKLGMLNKIQEERPKIPLYEELPESVRNVVRRQAQQTFSDQITKHKAEILEEITKQFNLHNVHALFSSKLTPQSQLNSIINSASSQFTSILDLLTQGATNLSYLPAFLGQ